MIMRLFLGVGLVLLAVTSYFVVMVPPPNVQLVPKVSAVTMLQSEGKLPTGDIAENEEIEHGIFKVPLQDEAMLESATADMDMSGMDMSEDDGTMTMPDGTVMNESDMPANGDTAMDMSEDEDTMTMPDGTVMKESDMPSAGDTVMDMSEDDGTMTMPDGTVMNESDMPADGDTVMDMGTGDESMTAADDAATAMNGMDMDEMADDEGGLAFSDGDVFNREITLSMTEWTFSDLNLEVAKGERIRFTVHNDGQILHEFMFMTMPAMAAVNYRAKRADWNLLEHEALFEKSLLLPGGEISFVVEVQKTGNWMFMCMLPYHMQMGMMGQMATPDMAMSM